MAESTQLLSNGDMEAGDSGVDSWWWGTASSSDFSIGWSYEQAHSGARSLFIREATGGSESFAYWGQSMDVVNPVGMTFQLSVSVKLDSLQGEGVSIAIRGDDSSLDNGFAEVFATTQGREVIDGTGDWATYTVELHHVPAGVDRITIYFVYLPTNTGMAYFDDATLSVSKTVPMVELQNTDVEEGGSYPNAWWWGGPGYANSDIFWSAAQAASGMRSIGIYRAEPHPEEFTFWAQTIDAGNFVGGSATLTVKVRTVGLVGQGAAVAIRADDTPRPQGYGEAFSTTQGAVSIMGTSGWLTYQVTLGSIPADARSVTVYLIHLTSTQGSVYFDDVSLVPG